MLFHIKDDIWFDNDAIKIYEQSGDVRTECISAVKKKKVSTVHDEGWRPTIIYLAATTCNLKCKYCYADDGTYGMQGSKKQFTYEDYVETYTRIKKMYGSVKSISFFGGEPLLNFKVIKRFVEYLFDTYEKDDIPSLAMNTNGTIMNDEILDFLSKYHFTLGTSVDGTKSVHDANRVSDHFISTYEIVNKNLKIMEEKKIPVFVQYTFTKQHLDQYEPGKVSVWCKEMENLPIHTYELIPVSTNDLQYKINLQDKEAVKKYEMFCEETADYYLDKLLNGDISKVPRMFMGLMTRLLMKVEHMDCSAGYSFSITPTKKIFPCHTFTEHEQYAIDIEHLHQKEDFLRNSHFMKARLSNRQKCKSCQECIAKKVCGVWCKGLQNSVGGELNAVLDERCLLMNVYTKKIVDFLAKHYLLNHTSINRKLIDYNRLHREIAHEG